MNRVPENSWFFQLNHATMSPLPYMSLPKSQKTNAFRNQKEWLFKRDIFLKVTLYSHPFKKGEKRFYTLSKSCVDAGSKKIDCMLCYSEGCRGNQRFSSISEWRKDVKAWKSIATFWTINFFKLLKCSHWIQISRDVSLVPLHEVRCFLRYFPNASSPVSPTYPFLYKKDKPSYPIFA